MSEQYHPVVEAKMVTDRTDVNFGRVSDRELAQDAAIATNEQIQSESNPDGKISKEKSGDFYAEDIERESNKQTSLKIGEIAAQGAGYSVEDAPLVSDDVYHIEPNKMKYEDDGVKDIKRAIVSTSNLSYDAHRQRVAAAREERKAA